MQRIEDIVKDKSKKHSVPFSFEQFETPQPNDADGNEVKATVGPENVLELIAALNDRPEEEAIKLVKACNYGLNLRARATARQQAEAKAEGPDKAIEKTVKLLEGLGYQHDEAVAIAKAKQAAEPAAEEAAE